MLLELGWSGEKRGVNEGCEGVFIAPLPQATVMCVFCEFRIIRGNLGSFELATE